MKNAMDSKKIRDSCKLRELQISFKIKIKNF